MHHLVLDMLKQIDMSDDVVRLGDGGEGRCVDGGKNEKRAGVVPAGGITNGLDASPYVVELKAGRQAAEFAAAMAEYEWKRA